jgi:hypothetical protein
MLKMKYPESRPLAVLALGISLVLGAGACSDVMHAITGAYRGPQPAKEGILGEEVVIRRVGEGGSRPAFIIDRVRFVEAGDPHDINRVARAVATDANGSNVAALGLQAGDRVIISTTFSTTATESGSLSAPDWPGPDRPEYPIGVHSITAIERTGP